MRTGAQRKSKRKANKPRIGWSSILQKDLSGIFRQEYGKRLGETTKRIRHKIKAGRLMPWNEGILPALFRDSAAVENPSGAPGCASSQACESDNRSAQQMSGATGPVFPEYDSETGRLVYPW